jgi:hypothetical protein
MYAHHVDPILTLNAADFSRFAGITSVHPSSLWRSCTQSPPFADAKDGAPGDLGCSVLDDYREQIVLTEDSGNFRKGKERYQYNKHHESN